MQFTNGWIGVGQLALLFLKRLASLHEPSQRDFFFTSEQFNATNILEV